MRQFLTHVQNQPKHIKDRYAFVVALVFTAVLGTIWGVTGVMSNRYGFSLATSTVVVEEESSPMFGSLTKYVQKQFAAVGASFTDDVPPVEAPASVDNLTLTPDTIADVQNTYSVATTSTEEVTQRPFQVVQVEAVSATSSATTTP